MSIRHNEIKRTGTIGSIKEIGKNGLRFSLANKFKTKEETKTHWIDCVAWGKAAERCKQQLQVGNFINVRGTLEINTWEKENVKFSKPQITVIEFVFVEYEKKNKEENNTPKEEAEMEYEPAATPDTDDLPF